jgi:hypothetical protein
MLGRFCHLFNIFIYRMHQSALTNSTLTMNGGKGGQLVETPLLGATDEAQNK